MIDDFKGFEESTKIQVRKFPSEFDCGISSWFVGAASYDTNLVGDFNAVEIHFPVIQFCLSALLGFEKPAFLVLPVHMNEFDAGRHQRIAPIDGMYLHEGGIRFDLVETHGPNCVGDCRAWFTLL